MNHRPISTSTLLLLATVALPLAPVWAAPKSCEKIALLKLPDTTINSATGVAEGQFPLQGGVDAPAQGPPHPIARRSAAVLLPGFCRVRLTMTPATKIEVWMPPSGWNGNFEAVGNGGKAGEISYPAMATALNAGYAAASTDTGHEGSEAETRWALGHPELVNDFAYRAIHEMTVTATKVIEAFYGTGPRFSYFNGCSTGGRQGLMEAQRYPDDYNGILSGDPVIYYTHLQAAAPFSVALLARRDPESYIPVGKLSAIEGAAVAACDAVDGVKYGLLEDPRKCSFRKDPCALLCNRSDSPTCLTTKQFETLKKIYGGFHDANGHQIYPGSMPGHETGWGFISSGDPSKPFTDNAAVGAVGFFTLFSRIPTGTFEHGTTRGACRLRMRNWRLC
jgi:feruloyl esterase